MKKKLPTFLLIISLTSLVGFNVADEVELDAYLNARTTPDFRKYTKNIATTLKKGTAGKVLEVKNFSTTGNSGIKIKVTTGPRTGESYWVYYNTKKPAIKLTDKNTKNEVTPDEITEANQAENRIGQNEDNFSAQTLEDVSARRDSNEHAINEATKMAVDSLDDETIEDITTPLLSSCGHINLPTLNNINQANEPASNSFENYDETLIQPPLRQSNEESLDNNPFTCITRDHLLWSTCYNIGTQNKYVPKSFNFTNEGGNKTVPKSKGASRKFSFEFQGAALSDMNLLIWDSPSDRTSHGHLKLMTFFPRDVMPAIRQGSSSNKDVLIVTLPNREEVIFNSKTKEIISGVLKEGPMKQTAKGAATNPDIQYTGKGVVIEASALGDFPVGFEGKSSANQKRVTIKKKGEKNCSVPEKDLWYTDPAKGSNSFFNKDLYTNAAFDVYVKNKCGFSIY